MAPSSDPALTAYCKRLALVRRLIDMDVWKSWQYPDLNTPCDIGDLNIHWIERDYFDEHHGLYFSAFRHLLKALELIALGSFVADEALISSIYARCKSEIKDHTIVRADPWALLKEANAVNPDFYPLPVIAQITDQKTELLAVKDGFLTQDELAHLSGACGAGLEPPHPAIARRYHDDSRWDENDRMTPFAPWATRVHVASEREPQKLFPYICTIREWVNRIHRLLSLHTIVLSGRNERWLVSMPPEGEICGYDVSGLSQPTRPPSITPDDTRRWWRASPEFCAVMEKCFGEDGDFSDKELARKVWSVFLELAARGGPYDYMVIWFAEKLERSGEFTEPQVDAILTHYGKAVE